MKIIWKIILVLVEIFVAITLLGFFGPKVASYWRAYQYNLKAKQIDEMIKTRDTAYKNDRDGGKTPEETFDMLLTALKAGNTLLASKYYEISVQSKALNSLQAELAKNGNLHKSIDYFTEVRAKGVKRCNERGDGCTFVSKYTAKQDESLQIDGTDRVMIIKNGQSIDESMNFSQNKSTSIWKITQPI